jgi:glycine/D-amino acid oxidase-like deaminating enzyme
MHGPAAGRLIAELITSGKTSMDISALSIERFKHAHKEGETVVI